MRSGIAARTSDVSYLPAGPDEERLEAALGFLAVATAVRRHAGLLETHYTPFGASYVLRGKDLTPVKRVIGSGGIFRNHPRPGALLAGAAFDPAEPESMRPQSPAYYLDRDYILPAMGLLADLAPEIAYRLLDERLVLLHGDAGKKGSEPTGGQADGQ